MGLFTKEVAIDLGTANTIIIANGKIVLDEPSVIAINVKTEKVEAIGKEAQRMIGRTPPDVKTFRPIKDGVIADFHAAELMIRGMIAMADL